METDGQRLYSVVTKKEVDEKLKKEIDQISEVFSLSKSDATIILIRLRWNSFQASDRLGDDKEKFLAELGLVPVFNLSQENESFSCFADDKTHSDGDGDFLVSTPFCSHKFCTTCWRGYLYEALKKKEEENVVVLCPNPDCVALVGPDTIEKFTEPVKEMYESYVRRSFVKSNKEWIKLCPGEGCGYAIERHEDLLEGDESLDFGVVCLCGHTFCWSCELESHRPVSCGSAAHWSNRQLHVAMSIAWILENTKRCPSCNRCVQRTGDPDLRLVTCICSCSFCWRCFRSAEEHNGKWNCVDVSFPPSMNQEEKEYSIEFIHTHYLSLWEESDEGFKKAKSDVKAIEENVIPKLTENFGLSDQEVRAVREAWVLTVQCRLVLKWCTVFEFFLSQKQSAKKQHMSYLRDVATKILARHRATVEELMNQALSSGDFRFLKLKLSASTTNTGSYFHKLVKDLQSGLPEVKVDSDENASVTSWFCDRCTFQSSWSDEGCKMCLLAPLDSPLPPPDNNNNNTASAHQQVQNMPK